MIKQTPYFHFNDVSQSILSFPRILRLIYFSYFPIIRKLTHTNSSTAFRHQVSRKTIKDNTNWFYDQAHEGHLICDSLYRSHKEITLKYWSLSVLAILWTQGYFHSQWVLQTFFPLSTSHFGGVNWPTFIDTFLKTNHLGITKDDVKKSEIVWYRRGRGVYLCSLLVL